MRRFLIKTVLFLALTTLVMVFLDLFITSRLSKSTDQAYVVWNDIFQGKANADIVCMGNSRAWVHYNPAILDTLLDMNTYNLGIDGSRLNRQIPRYDLYRLYNQKPKVIIQNIDFTTMGYATKIDRFQYFPYFYNAHMRELIFPIEPFSLAEKYLPMYRYANFGVRKSFTKRTYNLYKGYHGMERHWNGRRLEEEFVFHFNCDPRTYQMFDHYLAQAKSEGIQVIMVYAPIFHVITERMDNLDEMYQNFNYFSQKYNIPIIDYTYDSLCYDTSYFYNPTHLNKKGATIFSQRVGQDIKANLSDSTFNN